MEHCNCGGYSDATDKSRSPKMIQFLFFFCRVSTELAARKLLHNARSVVCFGIHIHLQYKFKFILCYIILSIELSVSVHQQQ